LISENKEKIWELGEERDFKRNLQASPRHRTSIGGEEHSTKTLEEGVDLRAPMILRKQEASNEFNFFLWVLAAEANKKEPYSILARITELYIRSREEGWDPQEVPVTLRKKLAQRAVTERMKRICGSHLNLGSSLRPRYVTQSEGGTIKPSRIIGGKTRGRRFLVKIINWLFSGAMEK